MQAEGFLSLEACQEGAAAGGCHMHSKAEGPGCTNGKPNGEIFVAVPLTWT